MNDDVAEAIKLREKRLKQSNSTKLLTDEELYKEFEYFAMELIKERKNQF